MIAADIVNTPFFWDFDLGRAVDFSGTLKSNIDAMNELAAIPGVTVIGLDDPALLHNTIAEAVGEAQHPESDRMVVESVIGAKPFVRRL